MSAMRRGLTPQVLATRSLHRLCTFMLHTGGEETIGWRVRDVGPAFALEPLLGETVEEAAAVVAPRELHVRVVVEPGQEGRV